MLILYCGHLSLFGGPYPLVFPNLTSGKTKFYLAVKTRNKKPDMTLSQLNQKV